MMTQAFLQVMHQVNAFLEDREAMNPYVASAVLIVVAAGLYVVWQQVGSSITTLVQNAINAIGQ